MHHNHIMSGRGCSTCRTGPCTCKPIGLYGKDVYYSNSNLSRFLISCGENFDSIIEKAFIYQFVRLQRHENIESVVV